jgi:hypothetical protein
MFLKSGLLEQASEVPSRHGAWQTRQDPYQVIEGGDYPIAGVRRPSAKPGCRAETLAAAGCAETHFTITRESRSPSPGIREAESVERGLVWNQTVETGGVVVGEEVVITIELESAIDNTDRSARSRELVTFRT